MTDGYCTVAEKWQDNGRYLSGNITNIQRFIT